MAETRIPPAEPGAALLRAGRCFRPGATAPDRHGIALTGGREADVFAQTDHPSVDADRPEYEPHGCPRCAAFKGGLVRASRDEAVEIVAAAHVHTIRTYGPDRIAGFSPIPAMSMVSHAAGARFHSLIGAPMQQGCSLDHKGGPGAGGDGPFGRDSGRRRLPLVPVENFHALRGRQTAVETKET
ncbi:molybdopterin-dependent oxidoreductase [Streptomyces sp. NRRL S-646]|uniref:molybdopterin-dependent oxidoreductase n=1 Tax=Streptomyces sp. NRRL S-646 TaxID=1463917 RepID=UPI0004CC8A0E|nr:molybdopterin-dependent oxidoreductase [Streptomyces sp. NRRL S-646]